MRYQLMIIESAERTLSQEHMVKETRLWRCFNPTYILLEGWNDFLQLWSCANWFISSRPFFYFSWIMIMLTYSTGSQSNLYRQNYINTHLHLISIIFSADTLFFKKIFEPIQMNVMSQGRIFKQHLTQNSIVFAKVSYCQEFAHLKKYHYVHWS